MVVLAITPAESSNERGNAGEQGGKHSEERGVEIIHVELPFDSIR